MSEHTPTPWSFDRDWHRIPTIFGANGKMVASIEKDERKATPEREANAELIIEAVNSHDALVATLRDIISIAKDAHATDALGDIVKRAEEELANVR